MSTKELLEASLIAQCVISVAACATMVVRRSLAIFPYLGWLLIADGATAAIALLLLYFRRSVGLDVATAYYAFFMSSWILDGIILVLRVLVVYNVFAEAMRPMAGLHQAGKIIFRWVAVVSLLVALALLAGPGVLTGIEAWLNVLSRLQQGVSVLTLCLLIFVCFAVRPLGLTFRSHLFGVSLGLGIASTVELVQAAWSVTAGARSLYSPIYLFSTGGYCVAATVWAAYFALPEPARKMILLPTTSPFFFWNRISEILGDSPGHVAVAGFSPSMLAPAEIEMLTAATAGEAERETVVQDVNRIESALPEFPRTTRPSLA